MEFLGEDQAFVRLSGLKARHRGPCRALWGAYTRRWACGELPTLRELERELYYGRVALHRSLELLVARGVLEKDGNYRRYKLKSVLVSALPVGWVDQVVALRERAHHVTVSY